MPRKIDLTKLKKDAVGALDVVYSRVDKAIALKFDYWFIAWICAMCSVEAHGIWERYVESRLVAALNHSPKHFIREEAIRGVTHISSGLASYVVRSGREYFDFRSTDELLGKGDRWLGKSSNPFQSLSKSERAYLDALAAIRNCIVHGSEAATKAYKRHSKLAFGVQYPSDPKEFLYAKDQRVNSPFRWQPRLKGLIEISKSAIHKA